MLCKKCGAEIANTSKFCGYCGEAVEVNEIVQPSNVENTIKDDNLGETIKIEPIVEETLNVSEPVSTVEPQIQNIVPVEKNTTPNNKKNNTVVLVIVGILLALVAAVLVLFAINNGGNSISVLKKAMANLSEQGKDSATATVRLNVDAEGQALSFSATAKVEKKSEEELDMQLMVDKSLFTEEMSIYAKVNKEEVSIYMESTIIDLLGMTSSINPSWVYYTLELEEVMEQIESEETNDLKLEDVIDEKHFVFVEKIEDINHYQLIIDQELVDTIERTAKELENEDLIDSISNMENLEQPIKIDFYITTSNEIAKIKLDMSEYLTEEDSISGLSISIEFKDLNNTKVEIPSEALNATTDIETYIIENAVEPTLECAPGVDCTYEENSDMLLDTEYGF